MNTSKNYKSRIALAVLSALSLNAFATEDAAEEAAIEEITVVGKSVSYANNATSSEMIRQQSAMTSALAVIDNLPGVLVNEGDTFGSDDWSTSISIRGFQTNLGEQQVGITVDGIANGNSNYGGGAKANRYIDSENLRSVEVSQGTSDIASRSNEALGGTLNFTTIDPAADQGMVFSATLGEYDAQKFYVRLDSGEIAKNTYAWFSVSTSENSDWIDQVAENERDHLAAKLISNLGNVDITAYVSYDDVHEDNYQRIYSLAQYEEAPDWDQLTSEWTGIPYVDQSYRKGWSTLRENLFAYLQAEFKLGAAEVMANVYYHDNEGRGDWVPPYIVEITDDGEGVGNSELIPGNTVSGGPFLGQIFFVNSDGVKLDPINGCQSSLTFPYGGGGAQYDPACHEDGAIPVGSYRHTHYQKQRFGINADFIWDTRIGDFDNTLRGGFWYEDYNREEYRDWHKITDSLSSYRFNNTPYWIQYSREFPVETLMYYLEDQIDFGVASVRLGVKQFDVEVEKEDRFDSSKNLSVSSDSDTLLSAGIVVPFGLDGLEGFAGYAENFAAIKDAVLERDDADVTIVEPETAENVDVGLRYVSNELSASLTYYNIEFDNRITFKSVEDASGIDFLESAAGGYINEGGVESTGFEASMTYRPGLEWTIYASYTNNDSEYIDQDSAINGNTVFGSAEDMFVISFDWQRDNYYAGLSTKYVGERWMDRANTQRVDSSVVSDFYIGTQVDNPFAGADSLEMRLTINNLFDEEYLGTIAQEAAWLGAPRTAAFNATMRF